MVLCLTKKKEAGGKSLFNDVRLCSVHARSPPRIDGGWRYATVLRPFAGVLAAGPTKAGPAGWRGCAPPPPPSPPGRLVVLCVEDVLELRPSFTKGSSISLQSPRSIHAVYARAESWLRHAWDYRLATNSCLVYF